MNDKEPTDQDVLRVLKESYAYIEDGHWCQHSSYKIDDNRVSCHTNFKKFLSNIYDSSNKACALGAPLLFSGATLESYTTHTPNELFSAVKLILLKKSIDIGFSSTPDLNDSVGGKELVKTLYQSCIADLENKITFESGRGLPLSPAARREESELIPA